MHRAGSATSVRVPRRSRVRAVDLPADAPDLRRRTGCPRARAALSTVGSSSERAQPRRRKSKTPPRVTVGSKWMDLIAWAVRNLPDEPTNPDR